MTRVILHVGQPKAGSTALQRALGRDERELRERGVFYPIEGATASGRMDGHATYSHNLLAGFGVPFEAVYAPLRRYYVDQDGLTQAVRHFCDSVRTSLLMHAYGTLVLSGEMICEASHQVLMAIRDWLNSLPAVSTIDVCVYFRSPVDAYRSRVAQDVKAGLDFTPPDRFFVDYEGQFARLTQVFGADRVHPSRFGKAEDGWDVVDDFACRFLGTALEGTRANEALALEATFFLAAYWTICRATGALGRTKYELLVSWLECNPYPGGDGSRARLRSSLVARLVQRHEAQLTWLRSRGIDFNYPQVPLCETASEPAASISELFEYGPDADAMRAFDVFAIDGLLHACIVMNEALNTREGKIQT
ncbi:hypothetical protein [Luteibacter sp. 9133]|uniref:hypothetical protein n=1 Tax=Luteibacter sp. 9133 TaxID=1500891 RepID=UPI0012E00825|nr:hypothetical protein [Luteibacter sp. 9133]